MKTTILITLMAIVIGLAAFLLLNNYSRIQTPDRPSFDAACAFCHDLPDPISHDALEWEYVVDRMEELIVELRGREKSLDVPWDRGIKKELLAYLERHAFEGMNPDDLPGRPEKGAKLFKEVCAACHTLPDPSMHSLVVWEYVISKMRHFQKDMGLNFMTEDESAAVLEYLEPLSR